MAGLIQLLKYARFVLRRTILFGIAGNEAKTFDKGQKYALEQTGIRFAQLQLNRICSSQGPCLRALWLPGWPPRFFLIAMITR